MNLFKTALLSALAAGSLLTSSLATAKDLLTPEGQLDLVAIERELEEAEAETARYSGGLIKTMIDMRIATLKAAAALAYVNKSQEQGSQGEKQDEDAHDRGEPIVPEGTMLLTCDGGSMLEIDQRKSFPTVVADGVEASVFYTPMKLAWSLAHFESERIAHCELNRFTMEYLCADHRHKGAFRRQACSVAQKPLFPDVGQFAVSCAEEKKERQLFYIDLDRGALLDDEGGEWLLDGAAKHHLVWTQTSNDAMFTSFRFLNIYTGKFGSGIMLKTLYPQRLKHALLYTSKVCKVIPQKI